MVVTRILFKAHPAFRAQALAVFPAHRLERQGCHHCVPQHRFEIDGIVLNPPLLFSLFIIRALILRIKSLEVEEFLHPDGLLVGDGIQAAPAFTGNGDGGGAGNQDTFVDRLEPEIQLHVGAFLHANECHTEILRRWYMFIQGPHAAGAAPDILDSDDQS